mmetsp:Transcript_15919/g.29133  ORF Transcript_15919/g.29133 Transcript_15919/m.29133 type:complete len:268 (-) Transcript_15919:110-913(-)
MEGSPLENQSLTLYTISVSHYCEAARWALETSNISFKEVSYLPVLHMMFGPMSKLRKRADPKTASTSTPLLVGSDNQVLGDSSWDCLRLAQLPGDDIEPEFLAILDKEIGPYVRQVAYQHLTSKEGDQDFKLTCQTSGVPAWQQRFINFYPTRYLVEVALFKAFVRNDVYIGKIRARLDAGIEKVEAYMEQYPEKFDVSPGVECLSPSSIALAALFAPLVAPSKGRYLDLDSASPELKKITSEWRATKVGAWTMQAYEHRHQVRSKV